MALVTEEENFNYFKYHNNTTYQKPSINPGQRIAPQWRVTNQNPHWKSINQSQQWKTPQQSQQWNFNAKPSFQQPFKNYYPPQSPSNF